MKVCPECRITADEDEEVCIVCGYSFPQELDEGVEDAEGTETDIDEWSAGEDDIQSHHLGGEG